MAQLAGGTTGGWHNWRVAQLAGGTTTQVAPSCCSRGLLKALAWHRSTAYLQCCNMLRAAHGSSVKLRNCQWFAVPNAAACPIAGVECPRLYDRLCDGLCDKRSSRAGFLRAGCQNACRVTCGITIMHCGGRVHSSPATTRENNARIQVRIA